MVVAPEKDPSGVGERCGRRWQSLAGEAKGLQLRPVHLVTGFVGAGQMAHDIREMNALEARPIPG